MDARIKSGHDNGPEKGGRPLPATVIARPLDAGGAPLKDAGDDSSSRAGSDRAVGAAKLLRLSLPT